MPELTFFAGTRCLGVLSVDLFFRDQDGELWEVNHRAYCCPVCGEVWGRVLSSCKRAVWNFHSRPCRKCGPRSHWPAFAGQFAEPPHHLQHPLSFTPDWPDTLVEWEFHSLLAAYKEPQP